MPTIDFSEIPVANTGAGDQDSFELFTRDFFSALGFEIEEGPSRGSDGGEDLIVRERLSGTVSQLTRRWVVSCKHYTHSKKAVGDKDEIDILGRVRKFKADGFMAFYSTVPSSSLMRTIKSHQDEIAIEVWDHERIEHQIISDGRFQVIFERYFPKSYKAWRNRNERAPSRVFDEYTPLACEVCGKDLLPHKSGNVALVTEWDDDNPGYRIIDVYWACRGRCDKIMDHKYRQVTLWESIEDLSLPVVYVRWFVATFNNLRSGHWIFADDAFEKFKDFTICMSQIVVRETTPEQWERIRELAGIPAFMGGLGYE
jgi:hypothetical protein